jgi:hypothetical protein
MIVRKSHAARLPRWAAVALAALAAAVLFLRPGWAPAEAAESPAPPAGPAGRSEAPAKAPPAAGVVTKEARQAIDAGLKYLAAQQAEDGSWGTNHFKGNTGITGLAGLAFLSAGHTPGRGAHGDRVAKAVEYVLGRESDKVPGFLGEGTSHGPMYGHAYAVLFLAEAHGTLSDKKKKDQVKDVLTRAVRLMANSQNKEGGWRYQPRSLDADITVTACQLHALRAARAAGVEVPDEVIERGVRYVLSCQDAQGGGFRYMRHAAQPGFARSAAAVSALGAVGAGKGEAFDKGLMYVRNAKPGVADLLHFYYGHYYAAQALARAGGKDWQAWYPAVRDELLRPGGDRQNDGGWNDRRLCPHYTTAAALLILQTPESRLAGARR